MSRVKNNKRRKKVIVSFFLAAIILVISIVGSYIYFTVKRWNNIIYPNVKVENIDLTGKNKEETIKLLNEKYKEPILKKKIIIKTKRKNYTIDYSSLDAKYNISETVDEALAYGKDLSLISKYKTIVKPKGKSLKFKFSYNEKPIDDMIKQIKKDVEKDPKDASIKYNGGFVVTEGANGEKLEEEKLKKDIIAKINADEIDDIVIEAPITITKPKVTTSALKSINSKLADFSTNYSTSSTERANNIDVCTKSIDGTVLMPGETFSFNDTVGERTKSRGYMAAPVIVNGKVESGLGGGICQVSTTLYNAVLKANLKVTERAHHTYPSHYVDKGLDATVDWGNIDLKFKNNFDYPIYIQGITQGRNVYFNIYSNEKLKNRTYKITTELYATIEPKMNYVNDPTLPAGSVEVVKSPHTGYKVKTYKSIYENGKLVSKDLVSNDYYIAVNGLTKRGTKK